PPRHRGAAVDRVDRRPSAGQDRAGAPDPPHRAKEQDMTEPVGVGLRGSTHPHASARVRALREIDGVQVVAAADDDPRLKYFTDKYDLAPVTSAEALADG